MLTFLNFSPHSADIIFHISLFVVFKNVQSCNRINNYSNSRSYCIEHKGTHTVHQGMAFCPWPLLQCVSIKVKGCCIHSLGLQVQRLYRILDIASVACSIMFCTLLMYHGSALLHHLFWGVNPMETPNPVSGHSILSMWSPSSVAAYISSTQRHSFGSYLIL